MAIATPRPANLYWKHLVQGRAIMFGEEFENCWYEIPGIPRLELSGDLSFRGPQLRRDYDGRPYVQARKVVNEVRLRGLQSIMVRNHL
jgi:hypothetical protein